MFRSFNGHSETVLLSDITRTLASARRGPTKRELSQVAKKDLVGAYLKSTVVSADAEAAYKAFLEFKDVVAAAQR